jgi:serine O-acetyltransferase
MVIHTHPSSDEAVIELDRVVAALRKVRGRADTRRTGASPPPELPSRAGLAQVVEGVRTALFPAHFGTHGASDDAGVDAAVAGALDEALRILRDQVRRAFGLPAGHGGAPDGDPAFAAAQVVRAFAQQLARVADLLDADVRAAYEGEPTARSLAENLFGLPGVVAVIHHRIAHELHALDVPLIARTIAELARSATGIDIHPGATIGEGFFIDHGTGVVIGETAIIGSHVRVHQGVTLAAFRQSPDDIGTGAGEPRAPVVEDDVVLHAGATIVGRVTVGRGSTIGGNVWLARSVPPGSRVTQALARTETFLDGGGI